MRCEKVLGHLSSFLDEMLDGELAAEISRHLRTCPACDLEFIRLKRLRHVLMSTQPVETPAYLHHLVKLKIRSAPQYSWRESLRYGWEYRWSRIRSTEGIWYWTRLLGTMATVVLFVAISYSMNPIYLSFGEPLLGRENQSQALRSHLGPLLLTRLGLMPYETQKKPFSSSDPKINDQYWLNLGENAARTAHDDTVSVFTVVDARGAAKVEDVLEYPTDDSLLSEFTEMIMSAGWRPASHNGRAVDSKLVVTFSKIYVYN